MPRWPSCKQAVAVAPGNDVARCDYVKLLLELKRVQQARVAFDPIAGKAALDGRIAALGLWLQASEKAPSLRSADALRAAIAANRRDFDARYELAQGHFAAGRFTEAMDELLEIVMRDKQWNEQLARRTYVAILDLMSKPAPKAAPEAAKGTLGGGRQAGAGAQRPGGRPVPPQAQHGTVLRPEAAGRAAPDGAGRLRIRCFAQAPRRAAEQQRTPPCSSRKPSRRRRPRPAAAPNRACSVCCRSC